MDRGERELRNQALFRAVNERIRDVNEGSHDSAEFVCECGDTACSEKIRLSLGAYADVRRRPHRFIVAWGHQNPAFERVVEARQGSFVVETL